MRRSDIRRREADAQMLAQLNRSLELLQPREIFIASTEAKPTPEQEAKAAVLEAIRKLAGRVADEG